MRSLVRAHRDTVLHHGSPTDQLMQLNTCCKQKHELPHLSHGHSTPAGLPQYTCRPSTCLTLLSRPNASYSRVSLMVKDAHTPLPHQDWGRYRHHTSSWYQAHQLWPMITPQPLALRPSFTSFVPIPHSSWFLGFFLSLIISFDKVLEQITLRDQARSLLPHTLALLG